MLGFVLLFTYSFPFSVWDAYQWSNIVQNKPWKSKQRPAS